jgi:hypothetical protein
MGISCIYHRFCFEMFLKVYLSNSIESCDVCHIKKRTLSYTNLEVNGGNVLYETHENFSFCFSLCRRPHLSSKGLFSLRFI